MANCSPLAKYGLPSISQSKFHWNTHKCKFASKLCTQGCDLYELHSQIIKEALGARPDSAENSTDTHTKQAVGVPYYPKVEKGTVEPCSWGKIQEDELPKSSELKFLPVRQENIYEQVGERIKAS